MKTRILLFVMVFTCVLAWAQAPKPGTRRYIKLPGVIQNPAFSDAVQVGDTLYIAGSIGVDPKTGKPPADLEEEMRILFDHFGTVLNAAGMTMDDLVMVQVFCPDLSLYDRFNTAYRARFKGDLPARAFVGSGPLLRGGHFEMLGVAVKR